MDIKKICCPNCGNHIVKNGDVFECEANLDVVCWTGHEAPCKSLFLERQIAQEQAKIANAQDKVGTLKVELATLKGEEEVECGRLSQAVELLGISESVPLHVQHMLFETIQHIASYKGDMELEKSCDHFMAAIRGKIYRQLNQEDD